MAFAGERRVGVDPAGRALVPGGGVVVDLELPTVGDGPMHDLEVGGLVEVDGDAAAVTEHRLELGQGPSQGTVPISARHGQDGSRRGGHGEPFRRAQPARAGQVVTQVGRDPLVGHDELDELIRRVRGEAATGSELQEGHHLALGHLELGSHLGDRRSAPVGQPGQDGEQPSEPVTGVASRGQRPGPPRGPAGAAAVSNQTFTRWRWT